MITTKGVLGRQANLVTGPSDNHKHIVAHIHNVPRVLDSCGTVASKHFSVTREVLVWSEDV
jgi:hypothetical protein